MEAEVRYLIEIYNNPAAYATIMAMPVSRRYRLVAWKMELEKRRAARIKSGWK